MEPTEPVHSGGTGAESKSRNATRKALDAPDTPDTPHFLVIDEINRGNLAKVFGELYFLLEYRDQQMQLQYSDELFSLPRTCTSSAP